MVCPYYAEHILILIDDNIGQDDDICGWYDNEISAYEEQFYGLPDSNLANLMTIEQWINYLSSKNYSYRQQLYNWLIDGGTASESWMDYFNQIRG